MPNDHYRFISDKIRESVLVKEQMLHSDELISSISQATALMVLAFKQGGKVLFCGNGGSAADAQHLSAELSGRFKKDRPPLFAEALHVNTSFLTAVANDYGFDHVYARMLEAMGSENDVIKVAVSAAEKIMVHATGNPAQIVAVGVAAAFTFVGTAVGYGVYRGGERLLNKSPFGRK